MSFDINSAVEVNEDSQGQGLKSSGNFDINSARDASVEKGTTTPYESFSQQRSTLPSVKGETPSNPPTDSNKAQSSGGLDKLYQTTKTLQGLEKPLAVGKEPLIKEELHHQAEFPDHGFLNSIAVQGMGSIYETFDKPLGIKTETGEAYLEQEREKHPVAAIISGTVPYIVSAPLFPEGLIGLSANFGAVSGLSEMGRQRVNSSLMKPDIEKVKDVSRETSKGILLGPVWHYSEGLNFVGRPFASALAKAGARGAGTATLDKVYGSDLTQAFKDGGIITALSLIFESPSLARSIMGKGIVEHTNTLVKEPESKIDSEASPEQVQVQTLKAVKELSKQIKGANDPKIVTATVKLPDGTEIHGTSHEDALSKIGIHKGDKLYRGGPKEVSDLGGDFYTKDKKIAESYSKKSGQFHEENLSFINPLLSKNWVEAKEKLGLSKNIDLGGLIKAAKDAGHDWLIFENHNNKKEFVKLYKGEKYNSGFTVMEANGKTRFVNSDEAKSKFKNQFNEDGEVKGLSQQEFLNAPKQPEIVNPKTLHNLGDESGKMDVNLIPGVAEITEALDKASKEYIETLTPGEINEAANFTSSDLRERLGKQAQLFDRMEVLLSRTKKMFDRATKESITDTYTRAERGLKQESPELQKAYDTLKFIMANQRERVKALGTGKLENFIENYLPHIWADENKAKQIASYFTKRNFQGGKSFLKKRSIENFADGIEAGLTPISWNPVDLTMLKLREMEKYILAHSALNANKARGYVQFVKVMTKPPEGWQKINDSISTVMKSPMISVQEAYDEHVMNKLNNVAKSLGIDVDRQVKLRGGKSWGQSQRGLEDWPQEGELIKGQAQPGRIKTKFAGPTSVIAHEIGHQIDEMYNGKDRFIPEYSNMILDNKIKALKKNEAMSEDERKDSIKQLQFSKKRNDELKALADMRYEGKPDVTESFKKYVRKGSEKMAVMLEAYIHAPNKFKEAAPELFKRFDSFIKSKPELKPLSDIEPSLVLGTNNSEVYAGGLVTAGHYYAQPDSARIFNNYLSAGLQGKSFIYDTYRQAGNTLNQFQLGLSAFHLGFTSMDATVSKFALGINKLSNGNYAGAVKEFGTAPFAPVTNIIEGRKLLQSWYGKDNGELTNTIAELMASAGGRAKMDKFYATGAMESMQKALKEGKIVTAAFKVPFYIVEQVARPIMEYIVPRQKMGVFMDMMKMEMERNPKMSHEQMRGIAQKAWNSVDNRMGQLIYDNLFWNRTVKDLSMASVRSLGWNLGTVREIGGGVKDVFGNVKDVIHGKATQMSYRTAYVMALPIVTGLYGAIYQYLHTGKGPEELKDYFFPKSGGIDKHGEESRISLPTYMKDLYHYTTNPVQTVINKFSPVNNAVMGMLANKDFYGTEIRNTDDPAIQQVLSEIKFMGSQFVPFGIRNLGKDTREDPLSKVEPFIGIAPAPYDVNMTKAERVAHELSKAKIPVGSRTKEQAEHSQKKSEIRSKYIADRDTSILNNAVDQGEITTKEKRIILRQAGMTSLERATQFLTVEETEKVYHAANDKEKDELKSILARKKANKNKAGTWTNFQEEMYEKTFGSR